MRHYSNGDAKQGRLHLVSSTSCSTRQSRPRPRRGPTRSPRPGPGWRLSCECGPASLPRPVRLFGPASGRTLVSERCSSRMATSRQAPGTWRGAQRSRPCPLRRPGSRARFPPRGSRLPSRPRGSRRSPPPRRAPCRRSRGRSDGHYPRVHPCGTCIDKRMQSNPDTPHTMYQRAGQTRTTDGT